MQNIHNSLSYLVMADPNNRPLGTVVSNLKLLIPSHLIEDESRLITIGFAVKQLANVNEVEGIDWLRLVSLAADIRTLAKT